MAYEQWQQTPQGLDSMFNSNVANGGGTIAATPPLMQLLGQQQHADLLTSQDQQRQLDFNTAMDPLRIQQQGLANQRADAELPGVRANSHIQQLKDQLETATNPSAISAGVAKNGAAAMGSHADELGALGTVLQQHAAGIEANPLGAAQRTKDLLTSMGHPEFYNPAFAELDPQTQANVVRQMGAAFQDASAKSRLALQQIGLKNEGAANIASIRNAGQVETARIRAEAANKLTEAKERMAQIPKNYQMYAAQMDKLAAQAEAENTPEGNAEALRYRREAYEAMVRAQNMPVPGAAVRTAPEVDLGALQDNKLQPRGPQPVIPTPTPPASAPQPAPVPRPAPQPASAVPQAAPAGRIMVRNVKTGQVGHIPKEQMEEALKNGYEVLNSGATSR